MKKILIVDDVATNRIVLKVKLGAACYQALLAVNGQNGLKLAEEERPDLILLDLMLPDGLGIPFLKALRAKGQVVPVIILTALDQISDRIAGLKAGADDYLVKPFDLDELSARIGAVARRYGGNPNPVLTLGDLDIDSAARRITRKGRAIPLTAREWVLFEAFLQKPGQLLSKPQLEERLYSFDAEVESNTIEVHVSRLRKKLGADLIVTERGLGYRLGPA